MNHSISNGHEQYLIGPHQLAFDITNKCNLRCLHCYNFSGENIVISDELTDDEVVEFISSLIPLKLFNVCFCGGEPLLRKDLLVKCAKILNKGGVSNIAIVSNGLLLTNDILLELINAGINKVQISIDGGCKESHDKLRNKAGAFERAMNAVNLVAHSPIQLSIAFTPTSFNINEVYTVYNNLKVYHRPIEFRIQPLMPMGRANNNVKEIMPSNVQYRGLVREINRIKANDEGLINVSWGDPVDHLIRFTTINMPYVHSNVRANGDIIVSPYIPLVVGNIKRHMYREYWENGLNQVWKYNVTRAIASQIQSISDMDGLQERICVYKDTDINIDLIEQDLNDLSLIKYGDSFADSYNRETRQMKG